MEQIIKRIQDKISDKIPNINRGGCVHFAYFLSRELSNLNIEHSIVILDYDECIGVYKSHYTKMSKCGCSHIFINIPNLGAVDGKNMISINEMCSKYSSSNMKIFGKYTYKNLNYLRRDPNAWNSVYNRNQNRLLSRIIKESFNDYRRT